MYYEIEEFIRLAEAKESAQIHNQYSVLELKVMDEARKQMGNRIPGRSIGRKSWKISKH